MNAWEKLPTWGKWMSSVVAGLAAVGMLINWGMTGADALHWESEAEANKIELEEHHDEDVKELLQMIADEKKTDRIGRNKRKLKRLERDFIAGRYANDNERQFLIEEIADLKRAIRCDEEGIC